MTLPRDSEYHTQLFYSCIGFTVGATLGSLVARKELGKTGRVILFVGDGSLQMTVQVRASLQFGDLKGRVANTGCRRSAL